MDNYLSHRWPQGPGVQPPPVPHPAALRRPLQVPFLPFEEKGCQLS